MEGPSQEVLWKQYELQVDLLKFYLRLLLEINALYYAITGGILSFYASKAPTTPQMRWALVLPLLMSAFLSALFFWGGNLATFSTQEIKSAAGALQLRIAPEGTVLTVFCNVFAVLCLFVAIGLLGLVTGFLTI